MTLLTTLDGVPNFRDLGGLPTKDRTTRSGVVYRSAAPGSATDTGVAELGGSTISFIADLRTSEERQMQPTRLPDTRAIHIDELPILAGGLSQDALTQSIGAGSSAQDMQSALAKMDIPTLAELYLTILKEGPQQFATFASRVSQAAAAGESVLVHCTAGKDRTGVACALILDTAGVERDAIVDNYAQSQAYLAGPWADGMIAALKKAGVPDDPRLIALVTTTPPDAIVGALNWVDTNYGGSKQYLLAAGTSEADIAGVIAALLGD